MESRAPLTGVRVLDLSNYLAGPVATKVLRQLGAEVVKVEPPTGDPSRRGSGVGPSAEHNGPALTLHRNKRSIALDLKQPEGLAIFTKLVARSDVLVENYRPGLAEKLGIGYEEVARANPMIVYCSISGYGGTGPMSMVPTTDGPVQAFAGVASLSSPPDGSPGSVSPVLLADVPGGLFAAHAIIAALYGRERAGHGCAIDVSLYESLLQMLPYQIQEALIGVPAIPRRNSGPQMPMLQAADGKWIFVQLPFPPIADRFNALVSEMSGTPDLVEDPRFATPAARSDNAEAYVDLIRRAFTRRMHTDWVQAFWTAGIPAAPVNTLAESLHSEHLAARSGLAHVRNGPRDVEVLGNPFAFVSGASVPREERTPPFIGEHNAEILHELGYADADIASLEERGIVTSPLPTVSV